MDQLPIWLSLRERDVLVVGGTRAATAKLRLALAAGARVTLVAPSLGAEAAELVRSGSIDYRARPFEAADVRAQALVYGATGVEVIDEQVSRAARAAGVLVNVVDRPALSDFSMPAIVDRSPVVVGISTGGAVPALAVAVRNRIESVLPVRLGRLAVFAESFRTAIRSKIASGPARLRFWQRVVTGPIAEKVLAGQEYSARAHMMHALNDAGAEHAAAGTVSLVGAGPGDPDLLTVRALRLLQMADVLVYDRLVGSGVLEYARRDAERIFVGKEPTRHPVSQNEINDLLVARARSGLNVVRLKGGDPFIFGRGGEEAEYLRAAGVQVEVVPGVTAALACAAVAGVPLTHRDHAMEVTFVTGHGREGGPAPDWATLARARHTIVVYMGIAHAAEISANLIEHGLSAGTPVAVVQDGTLATQRVVAGTLGTLGALVADNRIQNPALFLIGEVARNAQADAVVVSGVSAVAG